jgi:hypothetical protein
MYRLGGVAALILGLAALTQAQNFAHLGSRSNSLKLDRGQIIAWEDQSKDRGADQIKVYNRQGNLVTKISILRLVPEASEVDIDDVAITPGGMIVVPATFGRGRGALPAPTLLYFDLKGRLLSAVALLPSRPISRLAADEDSNIWTLTEGAALKDPSSVPMLVKYDSMGNVMRELLKRSEFPADAVVNSNDIGVTGFGYDNGVVWFWTPGSQDLVTVDVSRGSFTKVHTGLPNKSPAETPLGTFRDSEGLVTRILGALTRDTRGTLSLFRWSPTTKVWAQIQPVGCEHMIHLVGVENGRGIFAGPSATNGMDICAADL